MKYETVKVESFSLGREMVLSSLAFDGKETIQALCAPLALAVKILMTSLKPSCS